MILTLLVSLMALNLVQAKHFLVETEDNFNYPGQSGNIKDI